MKKKQKSLWLSGISLATCIAMLAGTTFAWFSDTATSNGNVITAGTLDITVTAQDLKAVESGTTGAYTITNTEGETVYQLAEDTTATEVNLATTTDKFISNDNWEPGCVDAKLITVKNDGSLATKISINAVVHDKELQDALWVDLYNVSENGTEVTGKFNPVPMSKLSEGLATRDGYVLEEKDDSFQVIAIYGMNESAGNEYQEKSFSADLQFVATQATFEKDGLGRNDYDAEAVEDVVTVATADELAAQIARVNGTQEDPETQLLNGTIVLMDNITANAAFTNIVNIDLNGYTLTGNLSINHATSTETVDVENGKVSGNVDIQIPMGSVNLIDVAVTGEKVILDASDNTLTLRGVTSFKNTAGENIAVTIGDDTRVVTELVKDVQLTVGSNVTVENELTGEVIEPEEDKDVTLTGGTLVTNYTELVDAINAAKDGDVIVLSEGTFEFAETINIEKSLTLVGYGMDETILTPSTASMQAFKISNSAESVTLDGLYFTGFYSGSKGGNVMLIGGTAEANQFAGDFVMTDCKIDDFGKQAIWMAGNNDTTTVLIDGCYFDGYSTTSGKAGNTITLNLIPNAVVTNNTFINILSTSPDWSSVAVYMSQGTLATIKGNTIQNCGNAAIWLDTQYDCQFLVDSWGLATVYEEVETICNNFVNADTIVSDNTFVDEEIGVLYSVKRADGGLYVFNDTDSEDYKFEGPYGYNYRVRNENYLDKYDYSKHKVAYTTLEEAIDSSIAGETIYIVENTTVTEDCTIPEGVTVEVASGVELTIEKVGIDLINCGTLINNGTIINNGSLKNNEKSSSTLAGMEIINNGTITNNNVMYNYNNATFTNNGTIVNEATFTNYGTFTNGVDGTITNNETLNNYLTLVNDGTITNKLTLTNGYKEAWAQYRLGAVLTNNNIIINEGTLTNYETINNSGSVTGSGTVTDTGTWTGSKP